MKIKRFGKLKFAFISTFIHKTDAREEANSIRRRGYNARVVKGHGAWDVYREVV
jgi:hypothetical protein